MSHPNSTLAPDGFLQKFLCLRLTPRELWIIYIAYVIENLAYQAGTSSVVPLWLSSDLGFSDTNAGWMISIWSAAITLVTVFVGSLTDAIGIRKTFLIGFAVCLVSRIIMTATIGFWLSGQLLVSFCPEQGERNPEMMWIIIGAMALVTPIGAFVFRRGIQTHEEGRHA